MTLKNMLNFFKRDLMTQLILELRHRKITSYYAHQLAKEVVPLFATGSIQEFSNLAARISRFYPEVRDAFVKVLREHELETVEKKLEDAHFFIGINDVDRALFALKGGEN